MTGRHWEIHATREHYVERNRESDRGIGDNPNATSAFGRARPKGRDSFGDYDALCKSRNSKKVNHAF
jgi:hypothetical protein